MNPPGSVLLMATALVVIWSCVHSEGFEDRCLSMACKFRLWRKGRNCNICPAAAMPEFGENSCSVPAFCAFPSLDDSRSGGKRLLPFVNWTFSDSLLLSSGFEIDPERRNYVREVRNAIFSKIYPTPLETDIRLVAVSRNVLENILDLNSSDCESSTEFKEFVSGNQILKNSIPLTHRYGGHQFGSWASQLGDGRAHLLGEYVNSAGSRWELQLKGSGLTPYSRRGDGRAVLRSSVREFLCSEAMYHLGILTSRAAAIVVSDDPVIRDQFYNGNIKKERAAVVLRAAPSWFRIGSLEILAENGETTLLRHLVDFVIKHYFHEVDSDLDNKYTEFFDAVVNRTIETVTKWMAVGFTHGVCNTDNFSLLGLTIDYGPFGFMESYDPDFVPNTSDDERRYSLERQPSVAMYNMDKLRLALLPLLEKVERRKVKNILGKFNERYQDTLMVEFRKKLGLFNELEKDSTLVAALLYLMQETQADFTMTFRQLGELSEEQLTRSSIPTESWALQELKNHKLFSNWVESYSRRLLQNPPNVSDKARMASMNAVNPRYVLRNWMAEQAIRKAEKNDFSEVRKLLRILQRPYKLQQEAESAGFASRRPNWANDLKVSCSS